jgi:hypothetical protein
MLKAITSTKELIEGGILKKGEYETVYLYVDESEQFEDLLEMLRAQIPIWETVQVIELYEAIILNRPLQFEDSKGILVSLPKGTKLIGLLLYGCCFDQETDDDCIKSYIFEQNVPEVRLMLSKQLKNINESDYKTTKIIFHIDEDSLEPVDFELAN